MKYLSEANSGTFLIMRTLPYLSSRVPVLPHLPLPKTNSNTQETQEEESPGVVFARPKYQGYVGNVAANRDQFHLHRNFFSSGCKLTRSVLTSTIFVLVLRNTPRVFCYAVVVTFHTQ